MQRLRAITVVIILLHSFASIILIKAIAMRNPYHKKKIISQSRPSIFNISQSLLNGRRV